MTGKNNPQTAGESGASVNLIRTPRGTRICRLVAVSNSFKEAGARAARRARRATRPQRSSIQPKSARLTLAEVASIQPPVERCGFAVGKSMAGAGNSGLDAGVV